MLSKIKSFGLHGIKGYEVSLEIDINNGLPGIEIVGLPDAAIKESKERVRSAIKNSGFVVTDSYHCVVFAILFRRPFIALVNEENSMKDRFVTLLCILGLEDRIVYNANEGGIRDLLAGRIEWDEVFKRLDRLRQKSSAFLRKSLGRPS